MDPKNLVLKVPRIFDIDVIPLTFHFVFALFQIGVSADISVVGIAPL